MKLRSSQTRSTSSPRGDYIYRIYGERRLGEGLSFVAERGKGLHAAECISLRQGTVDRIVSMILASPYLLLHGPPQSGITSLLELVYNRAVALHSGVEQPALDLP
ncbi:g1009 [Coccomyxa viridis]|uniref:G1009 protein n=1 Tax=Coccomyxa viridis TaxID=1274662 RepID=A0ABP1FMF5_9CHLO